MFFKYKARDKKGNASVGLVEARNEKEAADLLRKQELFIIDVVSAENRFSLFALNAFLTKVSFGDIVNLTRQLSTMVNAGLVLTEAINILRRQTPNHAMTELLDDVLKEIEAGKSLANALEKHPKYFSKIYVSLVRAGEAGGMLDKVLERLADNLEKEREFRGKIKSAMIYPTIIVIGMIAVVFLMMTVVVPKLLTMYKDFGMNLPLATRILITVSNLFVGYWWLMIISAIGLIFAFSVWKKTPFGKRILDSFALNIPVYGKLKKQIILVEFTRTLGMLVGAGLPILEALHIVSEAIDNVIYQEGIEEAAQKVEKGIPLAVPFSQNPNFPPILGQMVRTGEETGKLDEVLSKLSHYFEVESEQLVTGLTTAIEPIIMVVLGVGVAFLMMAIILPMYQMTNAF